MARGRRKMIKWPGLPSLSLASKRLQNGIMVSESPQEANLNNAVPKKRNLRQQTRKVRGMGLAVQIIADSNTRSLEGSSHTLTHSAFLNVLFVWP